MQCPCLRVHRWGREADTTLAPAAAAAATLMPNSKTCSVHEQTSRFPRILINRKKNLIRNFYPVARLIGPAAYKAFRPKGLILLQIHRAAAEKELARTRSTACINTTRNETSSWACCCYSCIILLLMFIYFSTYVYHS